MKVKAIAFTAPGVAEYVDREFEIPFHGNWVLVHKYVSTISCGTERANLMGHPNVAGGHNVRAKAGDRMRFKAMHKLYDYNARFGKGNMCVGCGRCDMRCPKDIHFSETIDKLAAAVENLKKGEN